MITIKDRNTKLPKDIWVYRFADVESGTEFLLSGRTMLDQAFEELAQEEGGMEKLEGEDLRINRGDDERTGSGNDMGTYEIMILE